jgi:transposase InsO family protein
VGWKEVNTMDERVRFTARYVDGEKMVDLCREFGISRKTGYKFIERYERFGVSGLLDQSRRPVRLANKTADEIEKKIINAKTLFPTWGPKKLKVKLETLHRGVQFPAVSTIGDILDRNGLVKTRRKRADYLGLASTAITTSFESNDVWCADFKGEFRLGNKAYCYPLTITDHFSRYVIGCEGLSSTKVHPAIAFFEEIFDEYGLPFAIKSDNGVPFGSQGFLGLTELSAWWMSLGIEIQRSRPGCPQDNGRHERMHRTLKAETTRPSAINFLQQQEKFNLFIQAFNNERPHEALKMKTPSSLYKKSKRSLKKAEEGLRYPLHDFQRNVRRNGSLQIGSVDYFIGTALKGLPLGCRELESGTYLISLNRFDIGYADPVSKKFTVENPQAPLEE